MDKATKKTAKKKPKTVKVWALTPKQAEEFWGKTDDEILEALGNASHDNLKALAKDKGIHLKDLATSCGITEKALREGVKKGGRFHQKPGAFDKMCRLLGFAPNEAGKMLGGIYDEQRRSEAIDARMCASAAIMQMHGLYDQIKDPADKQLAEVAISALWRQLKLLAGRQG